MHTRNTVRWLGLVIVTIGLAVFLAACGGDDDNGNGDNGDDAAPAGTESTTSISMVDTQFEPAEITVAPGTTVTWTNNSDAAHTVTSGTRDEPSELFNSGNVEPGATFEFTFEDEGTYDFFCSIHQGMNGTVTVTSENGDTAANTDGGMDTGDGDTGLY